MTLPRVEGLRLTIPGTGAGADAFWARDERLALALVDAGNGPDADAARDIVRRAFRRAAADAADPAAALRAANAGLLERGAPAMVSAVFGLLEPASLTLRYACAAHPAPIAASARLPHAPGQPLGVLEEYEAPVHTVLLPPGDVLAFFADSSAAAARAAVAERAHGSAVVPLATVRERSLFRPPARDPSSAMLIVECAATLRSVDVRLPAAAASAPAGRAALRRFLRGVPLRRERAFEILLAAGEAVANAVEHAYGGDAAAEQIAIRARRSGALIEIEIEDHGRWQAGPAPRRDERGRGIAIMRELADDLRIDERATGTHVVMRFGIRSRRAAQAGIAISSRSTPIASGGIGR